MTKTPSASVLKGVLLERRLAADRAIIDALPVASRKQECDLITSDEFSRLVSEHWAPLRRTAGRMSSPGDADDVLQAALLAAWRSRAKFDESKGTFLGWLIAIVVNEAKRAHKPMTSPLVEAPHPCSASERDTSLDIRSAIQRLPDRLRIAVELHYFVDLRIVDIAEALGLSGSAVKSALQRARAQIGRDLEVYRNG